MKTIMVAVLATMMIAGTALAQGETSFKDALTEYTVSTSVVAVAMEEASFNGWEGLSFQVLQKELGAALDRWQGLVVESCAEDWHTVVEVFWMMNIGLVREAGTTDGQEYLDSMMGLGTLLKYYQTSATVTCELGEGL